MKIRLILLILILISAKLGWAEVCPPVSSIHQNQLAGWNLLDSDDNKPLSTKRAAEFKSLVQSFAMVEWSNASSQAGKIRCYYRDQNGSNLDAYLTKPNYLLTQNNNYWYDVSGAKECAAGADKCNFNSINFTQNRVAVGNTLHDHLEDLIQKYWR